MAIRHTHFRGKVRLKGRPKEQAKAEIMVMNAEEKLHQINMRRIFFTILDILIIISFALSIYLFYKNQITNGFLTLIPGVLILSYFVVRRYLRNKRKELKR